jgi:hypothetical protein
MRHGRFMPASLARYPPFQSRCDNVVSVSKNVGFDHDIFADDALDRVPPAINQRPKIFNDGAGEPTRHGASINRDSPAAKA